MISAPSFFLFLFLTAHSCLHPPGHFDVDVNLKGTFTNGNVSHIRVLPGNLGGGECHSRGNALIFFSRQSKGRDGRPPCSCAAEERSQENHPRETTDSEERGKQRESRRAGEQERRAAGSSPLRQGMAKSPPRTDRQTGFLPSPDVLGIKLELGKRCPGSSMWPIKVPIEPPKVCICFFSEHRSHLVASMFHLPNYLACCDEGNTKVTVISLLS